MEYLLNQSAWRRGWNNTKTVWTSWQFFILDAVVGVVIGSVFQWYWGLGIIIFGMLCAWVAVTLSAPIRQRNEARYLLSQIPSKRKLIANMLGEFYIAGMKIKEEIIKEDFSGDAIALSHKWGDLVMQYFRNNPVELGDSKLILLIPTYSDWVRHIAITLDDPTTKKAYVYGHLSIQLDKIRDLIVELLDK